MEVMVSSTWGEGAVRRGVSWGTELSCGGFDVGWEDGGVGFHHSARGGGGLGGLEEPFGQCGALLRRHRAEADAAPPDLLGGGGSLSGSRVGGFRARTQTVLERFSTGT